MVEEDDKPEPNVFKLRAFERALDIISKIQEPIKSGDDMVLEVRNTYILP